MKLTFAISSQIAIAINESIKGNMAIFRGTIAHLKEIGWNDYEIQDAFMEVGRHIFGERR